VKKYLITMAKIGASLAILGYLFWFATGGEDGRRALLKLLDQPKRWHLLAAALPTAAIAVTLTLVRWCYLVRAVGIPLPMRDAMRIGWISYMFNFVPAGGIVAGDVIKAVMLAHEHPGNRAKSAASVIVDRVIGLYLLFVLAAVCIFATGFWNVANPGVHGILVGVLGLTAASTLGIAVALLPGVLESRWVAALSKLRWIGTGIAQLVDAMQMYRRNVPVLLWGSVTSVVLQLLFAVAMYLLAQGLNFDRSLVLFLAVYPVSGIANTVPLAAGPAEAAILFFYPAALGATAGTPEWLAAGQEALIVAFAYRLLTILVAPIGLGYYLAGRREVSEVIHEAEEEEGLGIGD
jgi:uncharacterized membrane protein YbhN (UPF0104 family)